MSFAQGRIKIKGDDKHWYSYWLPKEGKESTEETEFRKLIIPGATLDFSLVEAPNPQSKYPYRNLYFTRNKPPAAAPEPSEPPEAAQEPIPPKKWVSDKEQENERKWAWEIQKQNSIRIQNSITNAVNYLLGLSAQGKINIEGQNALPLLSYYANYIFHIEPEPLHPIEKTDTPPVAEPARDAQITKIHTIFSKDYNIQSKDIRHEIGAKVLKKDKLDSFKELSKVDASKLIDMMLDDKATVDLIITTMGIVDNDPDPFAKDEEEPSDNGEIELPF